MKSRQLLRILFKDGWYVIRQEGSHVIMRHPVKEGQIVMTSHGSMEMGKGLQQKILKSAGINYSGNEKNWNDR